MSVEAYQDKTNIELVAAVWGMTPQNPEAVAVDRLLGARYAADETQGTAALVAATQALVAATQRLGTVTYWLVSGTVLMGLAATIDVLLKLTKGFH